MPEKFLFFELKPGIIGYGVSGLVLSVISFTVNMVGSMSADDPEVATTHTLFLGFDLFHIGLMGSLIYGVHKDKRMFLLPYLIMICLLLVILTIIFTIFLFVEPILILLLFVTAFLWYVWLCVLTLYQRLDPRNPNYQPQPIPDPHTVVYVEQPPMYYENHMAEAV